MLDSIQDKIFAGLDIEPTMSALEIPTRLKATAPERFNDKHLRTVQRLVKAWRG
ncbi:hypothetical protein [Mesorhizobium sp. M0676]|uniref:hypothetical protein n=1 Tax=Mesorhizobium sp. M0676 TaxID=2956984 RepID=UPI003337A901